jgi:hypothetical protein
MKFQSNVLIQLLAMAGQMLNQSYDVLPPKGKVGAIIGLGAIQTVTALFAHFSNPDGKPASEPYIAPVK